MALFREIEYIQVHSLLGVKIHHSLTPSLENGGHIRLSLYCEKANWKVNDD